MKTEANFRIHFADTIVKHLYHFIKEHKMAVFEKMSSYIWLLCACVFGSSVWTISVCTWFER